MQIKMSLPQDEAHLRSLAPHIQNILGSLTDSESLQIDFGDQQNIRLRGDETSEDIVRQYREMIEHDAIDMAVVGTTDFHEVAQRSIQIATETNRRISLSLGATTLEVLPDSTPFDLESSFLQELDVRELPAGSLNAGDLFMNNGQGRAKDFAFSAVTVFNLTGKPVHYNFMGVALCASAGKTPEALEHEYCQKAR